MNGPYSTSEAKTKDLHSELSRECDPLQDCGKRSGPYNAATLIATAFSEATVKDSVRHLTKLAKHAGGPVLYVGCEASIVPRSLKSAVQQVFILDPWLIHNNPIAAGDGEQIEPPTSRDDPNSTNRGEVFPWIILPIASLALLPEDHQKQSLLRQLLSLLAPNGRLTLDYPEWKTAQPAWNRPVDVDLIVDDTPILGQLTWKTLRGPRWLALTVSYKRQGLDGEDHNYTESLELDLMTKVEVEKLFQVAGFIVVEHASRSNEIHDQHFVSFRRRADFTYPLCHPFSNLNNMGHCLVLVEGKGCKVRDNHGKEYIDASGGLWNTHAGLGDPEIISSITDQLQKLSYATLFAGRGHAPALELAKELISIAPYPLQWSYLTGSGSEATELSLRLARLYNALKGRKDKKQIVYLDESYHGCFFGSMSVSGVIGHKEVLEPGMPAVMSIPTPNELRRPEGMSQAKFALSCAQALDDAASGGNVAALIIEPILGSAGVVTLSAEYLERIQDICREREILLIVDEVATGFGRTGRWLACEHYDLRPDILLLSKGMTSGYMPGGAVLFSAEIGEALISEGMVFIHGSTYNGHPGCCAAALANIRLIRREALVEYAAEIGSYFKLRLEELLMLQTVTAIRGCGLMLGVVLVQEDGTPISYAQVFLVLGLLQDRGVLAYGGPATIIFCPALIITREEVDTVVENLRAVLACVHFSG
jgi:adenosylmethionine-8-amino-7-oxononanoate aminotransferase